MFRKKIRENESQGEKIEKGKKQRKPVSKKKKRIIIAAVVVVIIALVIIIPKAMGGEEPALPVSTGTVEKMDIEQAVSIKGTIKGSQSADVVSSLNYEIVSILVEEGDVVKKDQVLAVLDAETLQNDYSKALRALEESRLNYESSKALYAEGAISKETLIKAENLYENDSNAVSAYNVSDKTNIKSPISGTVTRVNVNLGRYANDTEDKKPMFVVEDLNNLKMDIRISEYDISKIKLGQKVTITAEVIGDESVQGIVSRISPTGELKDTSSKEMVIPVQIDIKNDNNKLIAGVTAKAKIEIEKKENVLSLPIDSILEDPGNGENYVMLLKGSTLKKVIVKLGTEGDFNVELISKGLSEGDKVVLNPTFEMTDGMQVSTQPEL